jgi:hypothetical protein
MSKIEQFWRDATADDVARVMAGETVEARFRDSEARNWSVNSCKLKGWTEGGWACNEGLTWVNCQVYREPSWYTDKPDPGPGWRLLEKFPDEPKLGTDEAWDCHSKEWHEPCNNGIQQDRVWYRRRIEVEPVESKPVLIRRRVIEIGDEIKLPNGRVLVFNGEGFEVVQ